jgi:GTP pyrophosphokinase
MFTELVNLIQQYLPGPDVQRVKDAYHFAESAHQGQKRKSGEPYIAHPVEVATILAKLKQDSDTLCAALLHDVLEDTPATQETIKLKFGPEVLFLVEGVTKLTEIKIVSREQLQAENIRKMFLAMAKDIRIVFIKLADRLHNMRTLDHLSRDKQLENARETMDIYAPLAHRLGLGLVKWELEDLSFRYLEPEKFNEIREKVAERRREREDYIHDFIKNIRKVLKEHALECDVSGRAKHFYSIYRKMTSQHLEFDEIYDLSAIRILAKSEQDCYSVLGLIHSKWKPIQGKIKDYIAMPKENMYQSLHTTVVGPDSKLVEIQIRTGEMHQLAEYGVASHWLYKETDKTKAGKKRLKQKDLHYIEKMTWLRKLGEEGLDDQEFMDDLKTDVLFEEVYVYTPKGDVYSLPQGATPVDFAYLVHTAVGNACVGAKVNNKIVPLSSELKNGDIVEILTRKDAKPNSDWLSFVKSSRTKSKIKSWISKQNRTQHLETGKTALALALKELALDIDLIKEKNYSEALLKRYTFDSEDDLFVGIGHGDLSARAVAHTIQDIYREKHPVQEATLTETLPETSSRPKKSNKLGISVAGVDTIMLKVANCCHPVPGDAIVGFVTMGYGITVHRTTCRNIQSQTERKIEVFWNNTDKHTYPAVIEIIGFDRVGIFKDLLNVVSDSETNMIEATAKKTGKGEFKTLLTIEVKNLEQLLSLISSLKKVKDVYDAYRQKS